MARRQYKPRYNKKRTSKPTKGFFGTAGKALATASAALSMAKMVKSLINVETKFIDTTLGGVLMPSASPTIVPLTLCSTGTNDETRNGNSIKAKSNSLKFTLAINSTTPLDSDCRIMIIYDKVSNGTLPIATDILDNLGGITPTLAHYNGDNAGSRFLILYDKRFQLTNNDRRLIDGSSYLKLNHHVKFDGNGSLIADATTGHMYLVFMSNVAAVASQPSISYSNRFYFIDN
jgi:hypothetical protein